MRLTRRELLASCAATPLLLAAADDRRSDALGFVIHSFAVRAAADRGFSDPSRFMDYCRELGARSVQVSLGVLEPRAADALRERAGAASMTVEGSVSPPRDDADVDRFTAEIRTAKRAGAEVVRTVMLRGRRYEVFDSADGFRRATGAAAHALGLAARVVNREGVRLAVENHKDWRADEMIALLKRVNGGDRVGVCVDTGNSLSLLEDPAETVEALAPLAFSSHLKDVAVEPSPDGFLLSEVPFGTGVVDLPKVVETLRKANPSIRFQIEMITRDPLSVPCLTDRYWFTFPDLPVRHLARTLALARRSQNPLPRVGKLSPAEKLKAEDDNIRRCLAYSRDRLGL